jgi:hypothetical protein
VVTLMAVGVVAILGAWGCTSAAAHPAHPSAAAAPSAPPTYGWVRSAATALDLGGGPSSTLSAVVAPQAAGEPWLIAGTRVDADGTTTATAWSSPNGLTWTSTALAGADGRALAAAAWGTRTVIVGSVGRGSTERAAVWINQDPGGAFSLVPPDAAMLATAEPLRSGGAAPTPTGSVSMDVIGAGTQGVFAAGSVAGRQAVWYSTDGTDWVRVAGAEHTIDGTPGAVVTSLLVTPDAVLAGGTVQDGTQTDAAIWTSSNGISWRRFGSEDNPFVGAGDHRIDGLTVDSSGTLVAVGALRSGPSWIPASWISPNGGTWSQPSEALPTSTRPQPGQGGVDVRSVASAGTQPGLVAVGGSSTAQRVWTSTDGLNWSEVPLPADAARATDWSADLVATNGSTTVVLDTAAGQPRVLVRAQGTWHEVSARSSVFGPAATVANPAGLLDDGGRLLLAVDVLRPGATIGTSTSEADVLASVDGLHWVILSRGGALSGGWIDSLRTISGAVVATGSVTTGGRTAAAIWTSATGSSWQRVSTGTPSVTPATITAVAAAGATQVAAGSAPAAGSAGAADAPPVASAWSPAGAGWLPSGALDQTPSVGPDQVLGACADAATVVMVGDGDRSGIPITVRRRPDTRADATTTTTVATSGSSAAPDGQGSDGTVARAWATTDGTTWTAATVSPRGGAGGSEAMAGCEALGSGFIAWGQTADPQGLLVPALWASPNGLTWTLEAVPTLAVAGSVPLTDLVTSGRTWVAVTGGHLAATADPADPTGSADDPVPTAVTPAAASGPDGAAGVWLSADGGRTWGRERTTGTPWLDAEALSTSLVQVLDGDIVVAGVVDGRVAVWVGNPPAGS